MITVKKWKWKKNHANWNPCWNQKLFQPKKKRNSLKIVCSVDKAPIGIRKRIIESTGIVNILEWVTANCTIWKWHSFSFNSSYFDSSFFSSGWYSIINNSFHSSLFFFLYSFILTLLMMVSFRICQPFFSRGHTHTHALYQPVYFIFCHIQIILAKKFYRNVKVCINYIL